MRRSTFPIIEWRRGTGFRLYWQFSESFSSMIASMTGFASVSRELEIGSVLLEIRSLNHRYLDIQIRLPDELKAFEPMIREKLSGELSRGKVECRLAVNRSGAGDANRRIEPEMLERLLQWSDEIRNKIPQAACLSVSEILNWPGIFGTEAFSQDMLREAMGELTKIALEDFSSTRMREGAKLKALLLERMNEIRNKVVLVSPKIPGLIAAFQEKLVSRLRDAMVDLDDDRIRHELTLFAAKIDVDEELSRLKAHLDEMDRILEKGGVVGKRLDFLMQELNREANTLGSKSADLEVSRMAMEIKVLIEQMREQIQNIE